MADGTEDRRPESADAVAGAAAEEAEEAAAEAAEATEGHRPVAILRPFLEGRWSLRRRITDRRAGQEGRLDGEAVFRPPAADDQTARVAAAELVWREQGILRLGDYESEVHRLYLCVFPAPARGTILFADGRPFHDLDLTEGLWAVRHPCGADDYEGRFRVLDADRFRVGWTVAGPRKDYVLDSLYTRIPYATRGVPDPG